MSTDKKRKLDKLDKLDNREAKDREPLRFTNLRTFNENNGDRYHVWLQVNGNEQALQELHDWLELDITGEDGTPRLSPDDINFSIADTESEETVDAMIKYFHCRQPTSVTKCQGKLVLPRHPDNKLDSLSLEKHNNYLYTNIARFFLNSK
jgi:hypothetical protein